MTRTPRQSTFTTETGDGYRLEFTVKGFVDTDAETYLSEILALAAHVFNDVYSANFEDEVVDMYDSRFRLRLEDEAKPSEYDQGWAAGRQAALLEAEQEKATAFTLGVEAGHAEALEVPDEGMVGKFLEVTDTYGGHGFPVGTKVRVVRVDDPDTDDETCWLATIRVDDEPDSDAWLNAHTCCVTAWVGPVNTKPWVDTPDES